jgi:hypothetical protein
MGHFLPNFVTERSKCGIIPREPQVSQVSQHYSNQARKTKTDFTAVSFSLVRKYCVIELYADEFSDENL